MALQQWIPSGRVHLKRADVVQMLEVMQHHCARGVEHLNIQFDFQDTEVWDHCRRAERPGDGEGSSALGTAILEDVRYRFLAIEEANRHHLKVSPQARNQAKAFLLLKMRTDKNNLEQVLSKNHLDNEGFSRLVEHEARVRWVNEDSVPDLTSILPDLLRTYGLYSEIALRAERKHKFLESRGLNSVAIDDLGITEKELFVWCIDKYCDGCNPADIDQLATDRGFDSTEDFRRAILREYCFSKCVAHRNDSPNN